MVFSSITFLFLFLPIALLLYFIAGDRFRNLLLLVASLFFYAWGETFFVIIMVASITANYAAGLLIERFRADRRSKILLGAAITINLGMLCGFKYTNFLVDNFNQFLVWLSVSPIRVDPVHLPIGISFFTFQAITYVVDVYRKEASVQRNPINIGLYISLFPQLIAGPIVRYNTVAKQIISRTVGLVDFSTGVERFIFGLGKKVLIANSLAVAADGIFDMPGEQIGFYTAWFGISCYTLQIYFDFSGYSDMAIGLGRMFGFHFPENFNFPYVSRSMREFWQRWHISLSTWFRDYLYIPLGGNRRGAGRTYFNLFMVFFLCGLWHGASWTFVVWGLLHGGFLVLERTRFDDYLKRLWVPIQYIYSLLVVVICWVFFRAETFSKALQYIAAMFGIADSRLVVQRPDLLLNNETIVALIAGIIFATPIYPAIKRRMAATSPGNTDLSALVPALSKNMILVLILLGSVMNLAGGAYNPFIYFRF